MYKILIVDDNPLIRMGIKNMITWEKFNAQLIGSAQDGEEAISMIREKKPDLVITDIRMPGMDGVDLLKQIRTGNFGVETIVVSAYNEFAYAKEAMKTGSINYILKPINPKELNEAVRQAIDKKQNGSPVVDPGREGHQLTGVIAYKTEEIDRISQLYAKLDGVDQFSAEKLSQRLFRIYVYDHSEREIIKRLRERGEGVYLLGYCKLEEAEVFDHVWKRALSRAADEMVLVDKRILENRNHPPLKENEIQLYCMAGNTEMVIGTMHELVGDIVESSPFSYHAFKEVIEHFMVILFPLKMSYENYIKEYMDKLSKQEQELNYLKLDEIISDADQIISKICREYEKKAGSKKQLTRLVKDLVDKNYMTEITPSRIAQLFYVSPAYLSRTFKQEEHLNLNNYITQVRMEKARLLLENTTERVAEIAKKVGYEDANYFTKVYKRYQGSAPKDSR